MPALKLFKVSNLPYLLILPTDTAPQFLWKCTPFMGKQLTSKLTNGLLTVKVRKHNIETDTWLIKPNYLVILPLQCSTTVSIETCPLYSLIQTVVNETCLSDLQHIQGQLVCGRVGTLQGQHETRLQHIIKLLFEHALGWIIMKTRKYVLNNITSCFQGKPNQT